MVEPPPPPQEENPFVEEALGAHMPGNGNGHETLDSGKPGVAARPGRVLVVLGAVGAVAAFLLVNIFSSGKKEAAPVKEKRAVVAASQEPPPLPKIEEIKPPAPPPIAPPTIPNINTAPPITVAPPQLPQAPAIVINPAEDKAARDQALARLRSNMILTDARGNGGGLLGLGNDKKPAQSRSFNGDPNSAFESNVVSATTEAPRAEATRIRDLDRTIAQGRIIQGTMESALNTDLPAPIRAIVSRDVYGEAGGTPLIPRGSRLIGIYNTDISGGQSRAFVVWTRLIRPDGVDIALGSPLIDQIGQAGIAGQVDTKFQAVFSRAVLSSVVSIAFALVADDISGGSATQVNQGGLGGSQTTGDSATLATVNSLNRLGSLSDSFIQKFVDVRPTILVDQGTPINIFVNRDLVFPGDTSTGAARVIN